MKKNNYSFLIFTIPFAFILIFGVLFLLWPKETSSAVEQRNLQQRPTMDFKNLKTGNFSKEMDRYYGDQFPLRAGFLKVNNATKSFTGFNSSGGENGVTYIATKKDDGSLGKKKSRKKGKKDEQVKLADNPNGKDVKAEFGNASTGIIIVKGQAMSIYYYDEGINAAYGKRITNLRENLPKNVRVFSLVAPPAISYYGTKELRNGAYSVPSGINTINKNIKGKVIKVNAYKELSKHTKEYLYLRTDHHWNGRGAYYAYKSFCKAAGFKPTKMKVKKAKPSFLGSMYGYTNQNPILEKHKDRAEFFMPKYIKGAKNMCYEDASMTNGVKTYLLSVKEASTANQYMLYSGADSAINHITSKNKNGKSVLVIKDSFGDAFYPLLMDHYENVFAVDPRAFKGNLINFIQEHKINDVVAINAAAFVGMQQWQDGFEAMISK